MNDVCVPRVELSFGCEGRMQQCEAGTESLSGQLVNDIGKVRGLLNLCSSCACCN
jgi:hypothetical protein